MRLLHNIIKHPSEHVKGYSFLDDFGEEKREPLPDMPPEDQETKDLLEEAMRQAEEMMAQVRVEAEELRRKAQEEGYEDGYRNGYQDGHQEAYSDYKLKLDYELDQFQREMKESIEKVTEKKEEILDKYMDDLKRVTLTIAEKIIQTSLKTSSEVVKRMILSATSKLKKNQWAKIYITKNSIGSMIQGDVNLLKELTYLSDNIKIITMESEEDGTCIIELPEEVIDASVNTQMENIRDILNNARL